MREVIKTQVRIPTDISKAISEIANFRHTSKNSLIIEALRDFCKKRLRPPWKVTKPYHHHHQRR